MWNNNQRTPHLLRKLRIDFILEILTATQFGIYTFPRHETLRLEHNKQTNTMAWVRERTVPTERPLLVGEVIAKFAYKGCNVVSVTDPYGRILGFLDRSRYFSIK
jgi:hypothetical protein